MTQQIRITVLPDDQAHPDLVIAAVEANIARFDDARLIAYWTDVSAGLGDAELAIRMDVSLETRPALARPALAGPAIERSAVTRSVVTGSAITSPGIAGSAIGLIERAVEQDLRRRQLPCSVVVRALEPPVFDDDRASLPTVRDDVRRLVDLVPRGRVTTVTAIGEWMDTASERVAATIDDLATNSRAATPWHRITAAHGRIDALRDPRRIRLQAARLESDGVPVRHERVVGFGARFIDVVRLRGDSVIR